MADPVVLSSAAFSSTITITLTPTLFRATAVAKPRMPAPTITTSSSMIVNDIHGIYLSLSHIQLALLIYIWGYMWEETRESDIKSKGKEGSGPPIGDLDPYTESPASSVGIGVPGQFVGWGHQSTNPAPPQRQPVPTEDADNLGGGVGVANWRL
ncbi:hypothetical protein CRG98_038336 [Punica granatum]|uniref:Uncharacterized protein n=1 Tax=Punica granatum TaxID=22663 RepID=A0A2I0IB96_PUNGR|nr:hypothetical protein CRG98_038336 [Punica granatum]